MLARGADSAAGKATGEAAGAPGGVVRLGEGPGSCVRAARRGRRFRAACAGAFSGLHVRAVRAACAGPLSGLARGRVVCAGCMRGLHGLTCLCLAGPGPGSSSPYACRLPEQMFYCPIGHAVMTDPVCTEDGHTYEREMIEKWFASGTMKSPLTGIELRTTTLLPNHALRNAIQAAVQSSDEICEGHLVLLGQGAQKVGDKRKRVDEDIDAKMQRSQTLHEALLGRLTRTEEDNYDLLRAIEWVNEQIAAGWTSRAERGFVERTPGEKRRSLVDFLVAAIEQGHHMLVDNLLKSNHYLISASDAVVGQGLEWRKFLEVAVAADQPSVVRVLMQHGANAEVVSSGGVRMTALMMAARHDKVAVATELLRGGAKLLARDGKGQTALMHSLEGGDAVFELLVDRGADLYGRDCAGMTPMLLACQSGNLGAVEMLRYKGVGFVTAQEGVLMTPLMYAVQAPVNALALVNMLLSAGAPLNSTCRNNWTALMYLCWHTDDWNTDDSDLLVLEALLKEEMSPELPEGRARQIDLDTANKEVGNTALMLACKGDQPLKVRMLLLAGAKPDMIDGFGNTALMTASANGHLVNVKSLLDHGADVNMANSKGMIPLMFAARRGHEAAAGLLLDRGADISAFTRKGRSAVMMASKAGNRGVLKVLLGRGGVEQIDAMDEEKKTALFMASEEGHEGVMDELLNHGARVDLPDSLGRTVLMMASMHKHIVETIDTIVERCSDDLLCSKDSVNQRTALIVAVIHESWEATDLLLEKGPAVGLDAQDERGMTALMHACQIGDKDVTSALLTKGASVNMQSFDGFTPLMLSGARGHTELVVKLLKAGADTELKTTWGKTAAMMACNEGCGDALEAMVYAGVSLDVQDIYGNSAVIEASRHGNVEAVRTLTAGGARIEAQDKKGMTALMHASAANHMDVVNALLNRGAGVNIQDQDGKTALMWACDEGYEGSVSALLRFCSQVTLQDKEGRTALMRASMTGPLGMPRVVALLMQNRVMMRDPKTVFEMRDNEGKTALMLARERGFSHVVSEICENRSYFVVLLCHDTRGKPMTFCMQREGSHSLYEVLANGEQYFRQFSGPGLFNIHTDVAFYHDGSKVNKETLICNLAQHSAFMKEMGNGAGFGMTGTGEEYMLIIAQPWYYKAPLPGTRIHSRDHDVFWQTMTDVVVDWGGVPAREAGAGE